MGTSAGAPQAAPPLPDDRLPRQVTSLKGDVWRVGLEGCWVGPVQERGCGDSTSTPASSPLSEAEGVESHLTFLAQTSDSLLAGPKD